MEDAGSECCIMLEYLKRFLFILQLYDTILSFGLVQLFTREIVYNCTRWSVI